MKKNQSQFRNIMDERTDQGTDQRTDTARYRVACPRLKQISIFQENLLHWKPHDLVQAYVETGLNLKYPSIPFAATAGECGYMFTTEQHKQASYLTAITQAGLLTEDGCELSLDSWWKSNFFLPFLVSAPTSDNQYSGELRDTVSQKPTAQTGGKTMLYLR